MNLYSFPKSSRILDSKGYKRLFQSSWKMVTPYFVMLLSWNTEVDQPRMGIIAARKHLKKAVDRNAFKRLLREEFRHIRPKLASIDIVIIARSTLLSADKKEVRRFFQERLQKIQKHVLEDRQKAG